MPVPAYHPWRTRDGQRNSSTQRPNERGGAGASPMVKLKLQRYFGGVGSKSALSGQMKAPLTGALIGRWADSNSPNAAGTIFLDEVSELPW